MEGCIFCKIVNGEVPCNKIYENDEFFSISDINPVTEGHSLVISKKHFETILDLPEELSPKLLDCVKKTYGVLESKYKSEGFIVIQSNNKVAQQEVPHVHFHIIPRKKTDEKKWHFD